MEGRGVAVWFCAKCLRPLLRKNPNFCLHCGYWFKNLEKELVKLEIAHDGGHLDDLNTRVACPICGQEFSGNQLGETGVLAIAYLYGHVRLEHKDFFSAPSNVIPIKAAAAAG